MSRPPSEIEREIVADILIGESLLIGSVDDIWRHPFAPRVLATIRYAVRAIDHLVRQSRALGPTRVKGALADVAQQDAESPPFLKDEVIKHLLENSKARSYWDELMPDKMHPHRCPRCGSAAFVGYLRVECKLCGSF